MPLVSEKAKTVLGRSESDLKKYKDKGTAYLGKVVMSAGEHPVLGRRIAIDVSRPHVMLIVGKRGGGKSYTMGVLLEEFAKLEPEVRNRMAVIAIDTVGIFWSMKYPNKANVELLHEWGMKPEGVPVRVLVPKGKLEFYKEKGLPIDAAFTLKTSELDGIEWLALFKLTWKDEEGVLLTRIVEKAKETLGTYYGIDELIALVKKDEESPKLARDGVVNRLEVAKTWGLFEKAGSKITEIASAGTVTVIDVSSYRQAIGMESTREIIVALLGKKLFEERMLFRKEEEARIIAGKERLSPMPMIWMLIDEAHMFMPKDRSSIALDVLLEWVRVGRQPGLSLCLATQRPEKLHADAISQADLFISHRMTAKPDIDAAGKLRPTYLHQDFDKYYAQLPKAKGFALILDDNTERLWMIKVRPRMSWDAGETATAFKK